MKQKLMKYVNKIWLMMTVLFLNVAAMAQEGGMDINVDVNKNGDTQWYANPWAWIIGGAIFILLLVAIVRGGSRTSD